MKNIVILGGGFAGVGTALELSKKFFHADDVSIILIEKSNCHTFTPALYEIATAYDRKMDGDMRKEKKILEEILCIPLEEIFPPFGRAQGKRGSVKIVKGEVQNIDVAAREIHLAGGQAISFSVCVFALGLETSFFSVEGAKEFAFPMKTVADAIAIRMRLQDLMGTQTKNLRNVVVVGGGFTGVETAAELSCCVKKLCKDCGIAAGDIKTMLIEAQPTILSGSSPALIEKTSKRLQRLGIFVRTNTRTTKVTKQSVVLDSGEELPADLVIWSTGVEAGDTLRNLQGIEKDTKGRIMVDEFLCALRPGSPQSDSGQAAQAGHEDIFAIGDNASFIDPQTQKPAPGTAYVAEEQAKVVAYNIFQKLSGKKLQPYHIFQPVFVTTVGGKYAGTQIFGKTFTGFLPWVLRQFIDAKYFLSILPFSKALGVIVRSERVFMKND